MTLSQIVSHPAFTLSQYKLVHHINSIVQLHKRLHVGLLVCQLSFLISHFYSSSRLSLPILTTTFTYLPLFNPYSLHLFLSSSIQS